MLILGVVWRWLDADIEDIDWRSTECQFGGEASAELVVGGEADTIYGF